MGATPGNESLGASVTPELLLFLQITSGYFFIITMTLTFLAHPFLVRLRLKMKNVSGLDAFTQ